MKLKLLFLIIAMFLLILPIVFSATPTHTNPLLQETTGGSETNLTGINQTGADADGDTIVFNYNWYHKDVLNSSRWINDSYILANLPFDNNTEDFAGSTDATVFGDVGITTGQVNKGFSFDGTGDYIQLMADGTGTFNKQNFTIEAWVFPRDIAGGDTIIWSYDYTSHTPPYYAQFMRITGTSGVIYYGYTYDGTNTQTLTTGNGLTVNTWNYIVLTQRSGSQKIYVNGMEEASGTTTGTLQYFAQEVWIGNFNAGITKSAIIDEVRFRNRTLSGEEVNQTYRGTRDGFGIINASRYTGIIGDYKIEMTPYDTKESGTPLNNSPADTTPPAVNITNFNTTIKKNDRLNVSCQSFDTATVGNITFNLTGKTNQYNFSFALTGASANYSQNITMNLTRGNIVNSTCWASDSAGNLAQNSTLITVANSPPETPTILFPTSDFKTNKTPPLDLNITFPSDADEDAITINYYINGKLNVSTITNITFNGSNGVYILNVSLFDGIGAGNNATINFTIDTTNPVVNTTINLTAIRINNVINISANITDNIGLSFCQVITNLTSSYQFFNFSLSGISDKCSQNFTIGLVRGNVINFTIRANDTLNNFRTNDTIITIANTNTNASRITNVTGNHYNTNITFNWTVGNDPDGDAVYHLVYWSSNEVDFNLFSNTTQTNSSTNATADGTYIFIVNSTDYVGEIIEGVKWNFTLDTGIPAFSQNCTNNTFTNKNLTCLYSIEDTFPYNLSVEVHGSSGAILQKINSTPFGRFINVTLTLNLTEDGNYTILINGSDSDKTSPKIKGKLSREKQTEEKHIYNDATRNIRMELNLEFENITDNTIPLPLNLTSFAEFNKEGTHLEFGINFTADKSGSIPIFNIKTINVALEYLNRTGNNEFVWFPYGIDFEAKFKINGTNKDFGVQVKKVQKNNYQVKIIPNETVNIGDFAEFKSSSVYGLNKIDLANIWVIDRTAPQITNISPMNNSVLDSTSIAVGFNATELYSDKAVLRTNTSGGWALRETISYSTGTSNFTILTGLGDGTYGIAVTLNDTAGNEITQNNTVKIAISDTTPPTITLTSPAHNTVFTDIEKIAITFRFSSNETAKNCTLNIDGSIAGNESKQQTLYNITVSNIDSGIHNWNATCYDLANNLASSSIFSFELKIISGGGGGTEQPAGGGGGVPSVSAGANLTEIITPLNTGYTLDYLCRKISSFMEEKPKYATLDIVSFQEEIRSEANTIIPILRLKGFIDNQNEFCGIKPIEKNVTVSEQKAEKISLLTQIANKLNFTERAYNFLNFDLLTPIRFFNVNLGTINLEDIGKIKFFRALDIVFPLSVSDEITKNPNIVAQGIRVVPFIALIGVVVFGIYLLRNMPIVVAKSVRKFKFPEVKFPKVEMPKIKLPEISIPKLALPKPVPKRRPETFLRARVVTVPEQKVIVLPKSTPLKRGDSVVIKR